MQLYFLVYRPILQGEEFLLFDLGSHACSALAPATLRSLAILALRLWRGRAALPPSRRGGGVVGAKRLRWRGSA